MKLVEAYSCRQLTYFSDRLTALRGVASKFADSDPGPYSWGIWGEGVAIQLAWRTWRQLESLDYPSWSWASVYGPCYFAESNRRPNGFSSACDWIQLPTESNPDNDMYSRILVISSVVVDASIYLDGEDRRELTVKVNIGDRRYEIAEDSTQWHERAKGRGNVPEEDHLIDGDSVVCMALLTYQETDWIRPYTRTWLVLRRSSQEENLYRRVAILHINWSGHELERNLADFEHHIAPFAEKRALQII
ncbi:hypothetical protein BO71DRAFT_434289 [Aspergillus ellipticus CBS 707.79]|uniref:Heterokaryon incompatibility domain-containing protein n=1 Tax=Aspergillus ellipticus CBS 707.79 TaxID=1448320 RepID=A0A319DG29_9EURO|nr:hypothetical protein BO71DRAFT_434289 [Aspergillus ellipticus CBS 707.79]